MKYTCIIVDDTPKEVTDLYSELISYSPEIEVLEVCENLHQAIPLIQNIQPQIIFMNVELADQYDALIIHDLTKMSYLIFTASEIEYSVKAFALNAFDFLLKPIDNHELSRVIKKILWYENRALRAQIRALSEPRPMHTMDKKVAIPSADGIHLFPINSIVRLKAERNYTRIHFSNRESLLTSKTLKSYEKILPHVLFQRVHQSHVLNLSKIKSYINRNGGYLLMEDGSTITVSSRKKHEILEYLKGTV
jgi:two-component system LytT family response regulator